jgi:hypothetical protein
MLMFTDEDAAVEFQRNTKTLSQHLISYTNNKTRIMKTRGKQKQQQQHEDPRLFQCAYCVLKRYLIAFLCPIRKSKTRGKFMEAKKKC